MSLSREQVKHIALLARLELTEEELYRFSVQLTDILAYFEQLQSVDTSEVVLETPGPQTLAFREDAVEEGLSRDELLSNAPEIEKGQFRIPQVIESPLPGEKSGE